MRLLDWVRVALRAVEPEMTSGVRRVRLGPQRTYDVDGLVEHLDASTRRRELVAVRAELALVPSRTDAPVETTTAHHVDGRGDLGDERGTPRQVARNHLAEADALGALRERGEDGPRLEDRLV